MDPITDGRKKKKKEKPVISNLYREFERAFLSLSSFSKDIEKERERDKKLDLYIGS